MLRSKTCSDDESHGLSSLSRWREDARRRKKEGGVDYAAACYGALCCFVLCVTFFACLLRRLPVYLVLLCRHAPRCARSRARARARARASACLVHHCTFSCVCSCLLPCLQWTICLLFEAFDFHKGFMFFLLRTCFKHKLLKVFL